MTRTYRGFLVDTDDSPYPAFLSSLRQSVSLTTTESTQALIEYLEHESGQHPDFVVINLLLSNPAPLRFKYRTFVEAAGVELIRECSRRWPSVPYVASAYRPHVQTVIKSYEAGASWFIAREASPPSNFIKQLTDLHAGDSISPYGVNTTAANLWLAMADPYLANCSERDIQIIENLLLDMNPEQTIKRLGFANVETLRTRRSRVVERTELNSLEELLSYARSAGITPPAI